MAASHRATAGRRLVRRAGSRPALRAATMLQRVSAHVAPASALYPPPTRSERPQSQASTYTVNVFQLDPGSGATDHRVARTVVAVGTESFSYFKARVAAQCGVPVELQRLELLGSPPIGRSTLIDADDSTAVAELGLLRHTSLLLTVLPEPLAPTPPPPPGAPQTAPRVVTRLEEARDCVKRDGVCILELAAPGDAAAAPPGEWRRRAGMLASQIFGSALAMVKAPVGVDDPSRVLKPHNDGANPYGDLFPDFLFMVCERAAQHGGESYVIDGHAIVRSFAPEQQQMLLNTPVESKGFDGARGKAAVWRSPMLQAVHGSGRWRLRAEGGGGTNRDQPTQSHLEQSRRVLHLWETARDKAGTRAARFKLLPGQAMLIDNYRYLHAREPDDGGGQRLLWRVWCWTEHRMHAALPNNCLCE